MGAPGKSTGPHLGCKGWVSFDRAPPAWQCTAGLSTPPDKSLLTGAAQPHRGVPSQIPGKGKVAHDMKTHPVQGQPHKSSPTWYGVPSAQHVKNSMGAPGKSTGPLGCPTVSPAGALPWLPWAHQTPLVPPCLLQASQLNVKPPTPCCAPCSCNEILHVGQVTAWQPEQVRQWDGGGCIARCKACHDRSKSTAQTRAAMQLTAPQTWAPAAVPTCKRQAVSHATRAAPRTRALMVPGDPLVTPDTAQSCASSLLHWHYAGEQPRQEKRPSASSSRETSCRPVGAAQCPHC